jgi:hypothetical protein
MASSFRRQTRARPFWDLPGRLFLLVLTATLCVVSGCGRGSSEPQLGRQGCTEQPEVQETRQSLEGDVTGDGRDDVVSIVVAPKERPRCRYRVTLESAETKHVLVLRQPGLDHALWPESDLPRLEGLSSIDERSGNEIVVAVGGGAATTAIAIATFSDERLRRMSVEKTTGESKDTLTYGASTGAGGIVDCVGGRQAGRVSELSASRAAEGVGWMMVERKVFHVRATRFELESVDDDVQPIAPDLIKRAEKPFPSCTTVRAS